MKQTEILTHATHVNGWEPAVNMSYIRSCIRCNMSSIEFIRSKLSNFSAHVYGVSDEPLQSAAHAGKLLSGRDGLHRLLTG